MKWSVDASMETPNGRVFAISERECHLHPCGGAILGRGRKIPALIVRIADGTVSAVDMAGRRIDGPEIDRRFPGALDKLQHGK